jgi:hypothetical protein
MTDNRRVASGAVVTPVYRGRVWALGRMVLTAGSPRTIDRYPTRGTVEHRRHRPELHQLGAGRTRRISGRTTRGSHHGRRCDRLQRCGHDASGVAWHETDSSAEARFSGEGIWVAIERDPETGELRAASQQQRGRGV